jgi:hypothetical protein
MLKEFRETKSNLSPRIASKWGFCNTFNTTNTEVQNSFLCGRYPNLCKTNFTTHTQLTHTSIAVTDILKSEDQLKKNVSSFFDRSL